MQGPIEGKDYAVEIDVNAMKEDAIIWNQQSAGRHRSHRSVGTQHMWVGELTGLFLQPLWWRTCQRRTTNPTEQRTVTSRARAGARSSLACIPHD